MVPAAYHRIARPIRHKVRFKAFANYFIVAGLVPMSISMVLVTYIVTYAVYWPLAVWATIGMSALIGTVFLSRVITKSLPAFSGPYVLPIVVASGVLLLVALVACLLPADRASRISTTEALRAE